MTARSLTTFRRATGAMVLVVAALSLSCRSSPPPVPPRPPPVPAAAPPPSANGDLAPELVQQVVRRDALGMRQCYQEGLHRDPTLHGTISTRFVVGTDGRVVSALDVRRAPVDRTTPARMPAAFPDAQVTDCVLGRFRRLVFPQPTGGTVTVVYPLNFAPR